MCTMLGSWGTCKVMHLMKRKKVMSGLNITSKGEYFHPANI